jgi:GH24 family phage-related lysozyme (muramidase)
MPLPPTRYIDAGPGVPLAKPGVAMAQGEAMARMGETIAKVGVKGFELAEKVRKYDEAGKTADFMRQRNEEAAKFSNDLLKRSDTQNWSNEFQEKVGGWNDGLKKLNLSADGMARANEQLADWTSRTKIHLETQAAVKSVEQGNARISLLANTSMASGDYAEARNAVNLGVSSGVWTPEAGAVAMSKISEHEAEYHIGEDIKSDPQSALERLSSPSFIKDHPGATLDMRERSITRAKAQLRDNLTGAVNDAQDDAVRGLTTDQLTQKYGNTLRPEVLNSVLNYARQFESDQAKIENGKPETQDRLAGEASRMLRDYTPTLGEGPDEAGIEIRGKILRLSENNPNRKDLMDRLDGKRSFKEHQVKTNFDAGIQSLEAAAKTGAFGMVVPVEQRMKVSEEIRSGFLQSRPKLLSLGYSEEQATAIIDGADKTKQTDAKREETFQQLWTQRGKADPKVDQAVWKMGEALYRGAPEVDYINSDKATAALDANSRADQALGAAKNKLAEWSRLNPDATSDQFEKKLKEIGGQYVIDNLNAAKLAPKPSRDSSTSMVMPAGSNLMDTIKSWESGGPIKDAQVNAYWDNKQWSIGYGTLSKKGETITAAEAEKRLTSEIQETRRKVETETKRVGLVLKPNELDALISFSHNLGTGDGGLRTLLADGKRSKAEIADAMLLYRNADGKPSDGLERRRKSERALFLNGYPS